MKELRLIILALSIGVLFGGCLKKDFDNPPDLGNYDPGPPAGDSLVTIAQLKAMNGLYISTSSYDTTLIEKDIVIGGVVVADDRSGNYYKQIIVQDGTGGIAVDIDAYSLYNNYPVGRKIYIRCRGLYLGYNGGTPELGGGVDERLSILGITGSAIDEHLIKANVGNVVPDTVVSFAAITAITSPTSPLLNRLVTIKDSVEFQEQGLPYTSPSATTNRSISLCSSDPNAKSLVVRTSNYATFHNVLLPEGRGTIKGILTIYKTTSTTPQFILRDTSDVMLNGPRCGGGISVAPLITIDSLRKMYTGSSTVTLPAVRVSGVVISDMLKGNAASGNFILEDGSRKGIILYLNGGSYNLGDSLVIDATGAKLQLYNGALELSGLTSGKISRTVTGRSVTPVTLTIAQLRSSFGQYENVLVKILNATIGGGTTYGGNLTLTDATGNISLYTASNASFASSPAPSGSKTVIGIATPYPPNNEIKLRDPAIDIY
jgi:hypothetical protein